MKIDEGIVIESPTMSLPWELSESEFEANFSVAGTTRVSSGYFIIPARIFGGLSCTVGLYFNYGSGLHKVELSNDKVPEDSFDEIQRHLETTFGPPSIARPRADGFPSYEWKFGRVEIVHRVFYRFMSEEQTIISCKPDPKRLPARLVRDRELRVEIERVWKENQAVYGARKVWIQLWREDLEVARGRSSDGASASVLYTSFGARAATVNAAGGAIADSGRRTATINGFLLEYRAYTLSDGVISVGTIYPVIPK